MDREIFGPYTGHQERTASTLALIHLDTALHNPTAQNGPALLGDGEIAPAQWGRGPLEHITRQVFRWPPDELIRPSDFQHLTKLVNRHWDQDRRDIGPELITAARRRPHRPPGLRDAEQTATRLYRAAQQQQDAGMPLPKLDLMGPLATFFVRYPQHHERVRQLLSGEDASKLPAAAVEIAKDPSKLLELTVERAKRLGAIPPAQQSGPSTSQHQPPR
jgi:hypothetical protein